MRRSFAAGLDFDSVNGNVHGSRPVFGARFSVIAPECMVVITCSKTSRQEGLKSAKKMRRFGLHFRKYTRDVENFLVPFFLPSLFCSHFVCPCLLLLLVTPPLDLVRLGRFTVLALFEFHHVTKSHSSAGWRDFQVTLSFCAQLSTGK